MDCGGGKLSDLKFPKTLSAAEQAEARRKLADIPTDLSQQLLDELDASIGANVIRQTPLAYLRGLITRARAGTFTPEGALRTAEHRRRQAAVDAGMRRNDARSCDHLPVEVDPDNPLVKKLMGIQSRAREKKRGTD